MTDHFVRALALMLALDLLPAFPAVAKDISLHHRGITVHATLDLAQDKTLANGVILMVHGTMQHADFSTMLEVRTMLRARGYSTLALNLGLGVDNRRGMYDCARPSTHKYGDALDEIGAWLDWLRKQGAKNVVLLGHSRGGQQAAWFSAERGHPAIGALVLLAPINPIESVQAARYEAQFGAKLAPVLERARALVRAGKGQTRIEKVAFLLCPDATVTADSFVSYYAPGPELEMPALLERVKSPTLVVVAGGDQVVRDLDKAIAPLVDGKRLRMAVIPGADHFFRDLYGEDAVDEIVKFLRP